MSAEIPQPNPEQSNEQLLQDHYNKLNAVSDMWDQIDRNRFSMPQGTEQDYMIDRSLVTQAESSLLALDGKDPMTEALFMGTVAGALRTTEERSRFIPAMMERLAVNSGNSREMIPLHDMTETFRRIDTSNEGKMANYPLYQSAIEHAVTRLLGEDSVDEQDKPVLLATLSFAAAASPAETRTFNSVREILDKTVRKAKNLPSNRDQ